MAITASTIIQTDYGDFKVNFHEIEHWQCISFVYGDIEKPNPIVRMHSACLFGEVFHSQHCDCGEQIRQTLKIIRRYGSGVVVYAYQEGRGAGLKNKIKAMEIQRETGCDTVQAFEKLGLGRDLRSFNSEVKALKDLGLAREIITFSGNPIKQSKLEDAGFIITMFLRTNEVLLGNLARGEVDTKKKKMGYRY